MACFASVTTGDCFFRPFDFLAFGAGSGAWKSRSIIFDDFSPGIAGTVAGASESNLGAASFWGRPALGISSGGKSDEAAFDVSLAAGLMLGGFGIGGAPAIGGR